MGEVCSFFWYTFVYVHMLHSKFPSCTTLWNLNSWLDLGWTFRINCH
jgi:hypothetical protein